MSPPANTRDTTPTPPDEALRGDGPPPFGGTWKKVYLGVILSQVVVVVLLALFGEVLS